MKSLFMLIVCVGWCLSVNAQFNTISNHPSRIRLEKTKEERGNQSSVVEHDESRREEAEAVIQRYMSVAYPLEKIVVTSPFGVRTDPFSGKKSRHNGLDVRANYEKVYAMMYGEVIKVGSDKRSGYYICIRHCDYTVTYCHLSQPLVKKGAVVMPGEVVAISGDTGRSTAPHLHIGVKHGDRYINPSQLLELIRRVREDALSQLTAINDHCVSSAPHSQTEYCH